MTKSCSHNTKGVLHRCVMAVSSTASWASFVIILFLLLMVSFPMRIVVRDPNRHRKIFLSMLQRTAVIPLFLLRGVHVRVNNPGKERFTKQAVVICNHESALDLMLVLSNIPNMSILMKEDFGKLWLFRALAKTAGYHFVTSDYMQLFQTLEEDVKAGYNIMVFPEGTRSRDGYIRDFQNGAFSLARYFNLDILPLHISGMFDVLPKGRFAAECNSVTLDILPRISCTQHLFKGSVRSITQRVNRMYRLLHAKRPSVCIIGGGMGGLFTGAILAETGYDVTVLEKNHIIGGGLQSFRRGEAVFNTGMHNFGGFGDEWALSHLLNFLHIKGELEVMPVDENAQEVVYTSLDRCYRLPKGREAFERYLSSLFPDQADGLHRYIEVLHMIANSFDHYMMRRSEPHPEVREYIDLTVDELMRMFVTDEELIRVLGYITPMCGHSIKDIPVSVYSMLSVLYFSGEYRFVENALQLAEALASAIQSNGGMVLPDAEVIAMDVQDARVCSVTTADGRTFTADTYVAAIPPKVLFDMTQAAIMRKVARNRAEEFATDISAVSLFVELKENAFPFINSTVLMPALHPDEKMPNYILMTTPPVANQGKWANTVEILSPVYFEPFRKWENTRLMHRGEEYEQYKKQLADEVLEHVANYYPDLKPAIKKLYIGSPLTIRDYYANPCGSLFAQQGLYMPLRTRTENLFLTGQSVLFHGLCGVPLTAILTAEALSGKDILTDIRNTGI